MNKKRRSLSTSIEIKAERISSGEFELLTDHSIVQRTQTMDFSRLDDAYLAIDAQKGYCYSLNATAGKIWEMLAEPTRLSELCTQLQQAYAVDEKICRQEVLALATTLETAGLLHVLEL